MGAGIYVLVPHVEGIVEETAGEMISVAKRIDPKSDPVGIVFGSGSALDMACGSASNLFRKIWRVDDQVAATANAEMLRIILTRVLPTGSIFIAIHDHFGMDLAPGLSIKLNAPYLNDVVDVDKVDGPNIQAVREEYNGQVFCHVVCDVSEGAVVTVRSGSFAALNENNEPVSGEIIDKTADAMTGGTPECRRRFLEIIEAETGDVDITKSPVLVSVGRGIEDRDNLPIIFDLAEAMGADVSCSRPVVDANWLEKFHQVGTSGRTVKPKVYMALGISGTFQHLAGIKGNPFIVAVNKNERAPIFKAASVGVVADILEFVPELTERLNSLNK